VHSSQVASSSTASFIITSYDLQQCESSGLTDTNVW
jgi:hypothetical protein